MGGRKRRKQLRQRLACVIFIIAVGCCMYVISTRSERGSFESVEVEEWPTESGHHLHQQQSLFSDDIINPHPYHFTISNPTHCHDMNTSEDGQPYLLILVKAAPGDFYDRQQIRQTWGGTRIVGQQLTSTLFLLGLSRDEEVNERIREESILYEDIVQENFIDAYLNLTIKNIMGMKWVATFCPNASYMASADADVMLNTFNLVRRLLDKPRRRYAEGSLRRNTMPVRRPDKHNAKWLTSREMYPEATYAPFFPGSCFVMSRDVAADIYNQSQHVRFLPWDDVFVGLVMKRIGIKLRHAKGYEQYVRLSSSKAITRALRRGIAVLIRHQVDSVDEHLLALWKSAVTLSQRQEKPHSASPLQIAVFAVAIILFFILFFSVGVALMLV